MRPRYLLRKMQELQEHIDEPDMSLAYREGQYYRTEVLPDQKKEALKVLEADRQWLAAHATIIPAEGSKDPAPVGVP